MYSSSCGKVSDGREAPCGATALSTGGWREEEQEEEAEEYCLWERCQLSFVASCEELGMHLADARIQCLSRKMGVIARERGKEREGE